PATTDAQPATAPPANTPESSPSPHQQSPTHPPAQAAHPEAHTPPQTPQTYQTPQHPQNHTRETKTHHTKTRNPTHETKTIHKNRTGGRYKKIGHYGQAKWLGWASAATHPTIPIMAGMATHPTIPPCATGPAWHTKDIERRRSHAPRGQALAGVGARLA